MVLILDVARFKYPSYWVSVEDLYEAFKPLDKTTGHPRGYVMLSFKDTDLQPQDAVLKLSLNKQTYTYLMNKFALQIPSVTNLRQAIDGFREVYEKSGMTAISIRPMAPANAEHRAIQQGRIESIRGSLEEFFINFKLANIPVDSLEIILFIALLQTKLLRIPQIQSELQALLEQIESNGSFGSLLAQELKLIRQQLKSLHCCYSDEMHDGYCH